MNESKPKETCLIDECTNEAKWKGLCPSCYNQAKKLIDGRETSWEELQIMGMCIIHGAKFIKAFNKRKKEHELKKIEELKNV